MTTYDPTEKCVAFFTLPMHRQPHSKFLQQTGKLINGNYVYWKWIKVEQVMKGHDHMIKNIVKDEQTLWHSNYYKLLNCQWCSEWLQYKMANYTPQCIVWSMKSSGRLLLIKCMRLCLTTFLHSQVKINNGKHKRAKKRIFKVNLAASTVNWK